MLLFTITLGGLLLMMGHQSRAESLFYYFRLVLLCYENGVPQKGQLESCRSRTRNVARAVWLPRLIRSPIPSNPHSTRSSRCVAKTACA
jgi:hypothetical protein